MINEIIGNITVTAMGVKKETYSKLITRAKNKCELCYSTNTLQAHHIHFRSQYKGSNRHELNNLILLCYDCHQKAHGNKELDDQLKARVSLKKTDELDSDILRAREQSKKLYKQRLEQFKKKHNGLSPSQYRYRQLKSLS